MRTTLTLDDDVARKVKERMHRDGRSFKETVNETLRAGLIAQQATKPRRAFRVKARPRGQFAGLNYDNIGQLLEHIEGPLHR